MPNKMPKTLKLTIKKQWFDMICEGIKTEEYRETTPYWYKRLTELHLSFSKIQYKNYKYVQFFNGGYFSDKLPNATFELKSIMRYYGKQEWGAEPNKEYFVLTLGKQVHN